MQNRPNSFWSWKDSGPRLKLSVSCSCLSEIVKKTSLGHSFEPENKVGRVGNINNWNPSSTIKIAVIFE